LSEGAVPECVSDEVDADVGAGAVPCGCGDVYSSVWWSETGSVGDIGEKEILELLQALGV
jgi:hypothetical protein